MAQRVPPSPPAAQPSPLAPGGVPEANAAPAGSGGRGALEEGPWTDVKPQPGEATGLLHLGVRRLSSALLGPTECQMMVLLDLTRSYTSMQRHTEHSDSKRCPMSPPPRPVPAAPPPHP